MFKIFVTVDNHQGFKYLTVKRHLSGLNIRPATLDENSFVNNFKIADYVF